MRNLLALLAAALLTALVVGWYLDWYTVSSTPSSPGHHSVQIDIDEGKIREDLQKGSERVKDALDKKKPDGKQTPTAPPKSGVYF
jgi:hypothetical protein